MNPAKLKHRFTQQGFSLPEIMVGMVIGLLGVIIILQMTSVFESRKRTTSSGDDAQNGGAIAITSVERDVSQAGYGLSSPQLIGRPLATPIFQINYLTPVVVNPPTLNAVGDPNSSKILVIYGNSNNTEGGWIMNPTATLPYQISFGAGTGVLGDGGKGFEVGDWVIPSQSGVTGTSTGNPHTMYKVIPSAASNVVAVNGVPPALVYNLAASPEIPLLFNLGSAPSLLAYAVINHSLSVCDYFKNDCSVAANWTALAGDVYGFRAQCETATVLRIALVTRSAQYDPNVVTTWTPTWNPNGVSATVVTNATAAWGNTWNHYRYKTFETMVPLRNSIWSGVQGCS